MQINVNGQNYSRWEDVPAEVRQQLAATLPDADKNGVPDLFEGNLGGLPADVQTFASTSIVVNGQQVQLGGRPVPRDAGATAAGARDARPHVRNGDHATDARNPGRDPQPDAPWPLQPGQVMLNGVPTTVGDAIEVKKPWWKRLFGG